MISQSRYLNTDPRKPDFYQNPYKTYRECRQHPVFYWEQYDMWCIASFELVNSVLRDRHFGRVMPDDDMSIQSHQPHLQAFSQVEKYSLLNLEPPSHSRLRSLVNHAFVARKIKTLRPDIAVFAEDKLDQIKPLQRTDLLQAFAMPVPATIIARMLGVPDEHVPDLLNWSHAMVKVYTLTQTRQDEIDANQAAVEFDALLRTIIRDRRVVPCHDLLSHLIEARVDGESLTDDELVSVAVLLLNAGHEATVHQTGNAIKTILESGHNPEVLFESSAQTSKTITELMRYDAPLHLFTRYALTDVTLDGVELARGEQIALLLGAANRDPARFTNADQFDPWRDDGGHVSLGAGVHYCVGALLAKLELEISMPLVFQKLENLRLASAPVYQNAFHFHGLEKLDVCWDV